MQYSEAQAINPSMTSQYVIKLCQSQLSRQNLKTVAGKQKVRYDCRVHGEPYKVGDKVWLYNPVVPKRMVQEASLSLDRFIYNCQVYIR